MWFGIISLFPEMFNSLEKGITGRAITEKRLNLHFCNPRGFTTDKHQSVDDNPYGGGPGMLMRAEPLHAAIQATQKVAPANTPVIYLSPQGKLFNQETAAHFFAKKAVILVAGRYEGIDERLMELDIDEEWSIGNYILSGGELAAMVIIDSITRLIPGALGDQLSVSEDSLMQGLLKYPQYTKPREFEGLKVPEVLLSGNHEHIKNWRLQQSLGQTWLKRPDLLAKKQLSDTEKILLQAFVEDLQK